MHSRCGRRRFLRIRLLVVAMSTLCLNSGSPGALDAGNNPDFLVVVNSANPVTSLDADEVSRLLLKKVTQWADGQAVLPVDQTVDSPVREAFTRLVHRRKIFAVKSYWQQRIFAGRDIPPPVGASDKEVISFVEANPGAIGYVSVGTVFGEKVRAIDLLGALP